jgi:hypothetical protein
MSVDELLKSRGTKLWRLVGFCSSSFRKRSNKRKTSKMQR